MFAHHNRQIFTIVGSCPLLRDALIRRNWVEKLGPEEVRLFLQRLCRGNPTRPQDIENYHRWQMLENSAVDFVWCRKRTVRLMKSADCYFSQIRRASPVDFTKKESLTMIVQKLQQLNYCRDSQIHYPRSYLISEAEQKAMFLKDYHLTVCANFINYLYCKNKVSDVFNCYAKMSSECIDFALRELTLAVGKNSVLSSSSWSCESNGDMYECFDNVMKKNRKICLTKDVRSVQSYYQELRRIFQKFLVHFPNWRSEGFRNIWILKPIDQQRGKGIVVFNSATSLFGHVESHPQFEYVVQKYIERPFLIYRTKFDMRQFFLLTYDGRHCHFWMYRTCYLKLSSQEFTIDNFHESIHLTNHAIQKNYENAETRNTNLPEINMWPLEKFLEYLASNGIDPRVWQKSIYPDMIKSILLIVCASLKDTLFQKNNFELYGADFMLTEDLRPVLIEINGAPNVSGSTIVSRKVCASVLEDVCKVVIDHDRNEQASTGLFQHIICFKGDRKLVLKGDRNILQKSSEPNNAIIEHQRKVPGNNCEMGDKKRVCLTCKYGANAVFNMRKKACCNDPQGSRFIASEDQGFLTNKLDINYSCERTTHSKNANTALAGTNRELLIQKFLSCPREHVKDKNYKKCVNNLNSNCKSTSAMDYQYLSLKKVKAESNLRPAVRTTESDPGHPYLFSKT